MRTYLVTYDVDRGSMSGDTVEFVVKAKSPLRAVRLARPEVYHLSDCIDKITLVQLDLINVEEDKEEVISASSNLFGHGL